MRSKLLFLKTLYERSHQHVHKTDMCPHRAVFVYRSMFCSCSRRHEEERRPENLFLLMRSWPGTGVVEWRSTSYGGSRRPSGPVESVCSCSSEGRNLTPAQTLLSPHTVTLSSLLPTLYTCLFQRFFSKTYTFLMLGSPRGPRSPVWGSAITLRHTTLGRTLEKWSARRRELYMTRLNTHNGQRSMPQAVFEPTNPAGERPQTHALDRAPTGIGRDVGLDPLIQNFVTNLFNDFRRKRVASDAVVTSCWMQGITSKPTRLKIFGLLLLGAAVFLLITSSCLFNLTTGSHIHSILLSRNIIYFRIWWAYLVACASSKHRYTW